MIPLSRRWINLHKQLILSCVRCSGKIAMLMKRTKALLFLLFALCSLSQCTMTEDEIYHIVTTVCEDAATGVTVNYHCNRSDSYVLVTQADDSTFRHAKKVKPVSRPWSTAGIENTSTESTFYTKERYVCHATLNGLEADSLYIYRIVAGRTRSDVRRFKTAGEKGAWNFVAFTDFQHRENPVTLPLIQTMKEIAGDPSLVVCSGDHIDVAGNEYEWTFLLDSEVFRDFVYAASPGDHAYWASDRTPDGHYPQYDKPHTFVNLFKFPDNGAASSPGSSYWFRYNNVLFVALDMHNSNLSAGPRFDDQAAWFAQTMDRLQGTYQYLVVLMHKSVFGSDRVDAAVARNIRPQWAPIFQKYGVDLVLSGHDHIYSRTYALDGDRRAEDPARGTFYLDMGSSGDKWRSPDESLVEGDALHARVIDLKASTQSCACNIEVDAREMHVTVYDQHAQAIDRFTIPARPTSPAPSL